MKDSVKIIQPGTGLGELKFGMEPAQVEAIVGKPDEIQMGDFDVPNEEEEIDIQAWHYDDDELSMEFEKVDGRWRLVVLSVTSHQFLYNDQPIIGKTMEELKPILVDLHLDEDETEEENIFVKFSNLLNISFWFENEVLTEVQWTQVLPDVALN